MAGNPPLNFAGFLLHLLDFLPWRAAPEGLSLPNYIEQIQRFNPSEQPYGCPPPLSSEETRSIPSPAVRGRLHIRSFPLPLNFKGQAFEVVLRPLAAVGPLCKERLWAFAYRGIMPSSATCTPPCMAACCCEVGCCPLCVQPVLFRYRPGGSSHVPPYPRHSSCFGLNIES